MTKEKLIEIMRDKVWTAPGGPSGAYSAAADAILAAMEAEKQPEPQPQPPPQPKSPGQVCCEGFYEKLVFSPEWHEAMQDDWHRAAAAVREQRDAEIREAMGLAADGDLLKQCEDIVTQLQTTEHGLNDVAEMLTNVATTLGTELERIMKVVRS